MKKLILFTSILLAGNLVFAQAPKKQLTLEDIWVSSKFAPHYFKDIFPLRDGKHYSSLEEDNSIAECEYTTGKTTNTLFKMSWVQEQNKNFSFSEYAFSPDESKILFTTEQEQIYRHSRKANYYIFDRVSKSLKLLSKKGKQQYASFSPDGNKVAFVRDNNLFISQLPTINSQLIETQITFDGEKNKIINGATDWVYEEEFGFDKAFQWSPDGKKIAYYRFDENKVKEYQMAVYDSTYPEEFRFKYPKAGEKNSTVTISIYDITTSKIQKVNTGNETDQYIPRIEWTQDANVLSIQRMNRHQNKLELLFANATTGETKIILTEENKAYIDITDDLTFLNDKRHFIWASEKNGFNHLYLYKINGQLENKITSGNWDVTKLYGIDEKTKTVYFQSAEVSPMERHVYSIHLNGKEKKQLTAKKGSNDASFSSNFDCFINTHTDANSPAEISLYTTAPPNLPKGEGHLPLKAQNNSEAGVVASPFPQGRVGDGLIRVLEDNSGLKKTLNEYAISPKEFFKFKTSEGTELNGWMLKPSDFDANKKYPVFMMVYGGPGAQTVLDSWDGKNYLWDQLLAEKGYILVSVDNRGTGARGEAFKKATYLQLGKLETADQIEAAKYLGSLAYIDKTRVGIWGWSYGGYMTSMCMTQGADVFKMGIAVAPVTDWRFYDTIYTERYMQTPAENEKGYKESAPLNYADKLKGKFLLVHGTADDNVHFQNSMALVNALTKANKQFDSFFYPNKNHSITGGNTRLHLYTKMTNFILGNL